MTEYKRLSRNYNVKLKRLQPYSRQIIAASGVDPADPSTAIPKDLTGYTVIESGIYDSTTSPLSANKMGDFTVTIPDPTNGVILIEASVAFIESLALQINSLIAQRRLQKNWEFAVAKIRLQAPDLTIPVAIDLIVSLDA